MIIRHSTVIFGIICAALLLGCTDKIAFPQQENSSTVIHASLDEYISKTQIVPETKDTYKVLWDESDQITLNGTRSQDVEISENSTKARFTFDRSISYPYYAIYSGNVTPSYVNGAYIIDLPQTQTFKGDDKTDSEAAVMVGYSENSENITFSHAMAYIRLTLSRETYETNTAWVRIEPRGGENISGEFQISHENGVWALYQKEGGKNRVTLNCNGEGAPIGTKMIIAIPAGTYESGLKVTVRDTGTHFQTKEATNKFIAEAGIIYDMSFPYQPNGTVIDADIDTDIEEPVQDISTLTPFEELNAGISTVNSHKDEWSKSKLVMDYRTHCNIDANNVNPAYPRIRTLTDGSYILTWQNRHDSNGNGKHTLYALSKDLKTWEHMGYLWEGRSITNSLGKSDTRLYTNANTIQLSNGEILAAAAFRASSTYSNQNCRMDHGIIIKRSRDGGRSWFGEKVIYNGPSWEPHMIELPDGEIQCFFSESRPWISGSHSGTVMVYSKDGGNTWSPELGKDAYRVMRKLWWNEFPKANGVIGDPMNCYTYQMPVGIILNESKQFAFAMESAVKRTNNSEDKTSDTFEIAIVYSKTDGKWVYMEEGEELPLAQRKDAVASGAAPYLIQFPSGETLLAYAKSGYQKMQIGNSSAVEFGTQFAGLPEYGSWGALDLTKSHSALSCIRNANDEKIAIARYHLNHSITATSRTVETDGKKLEWKNTDEAIFVGSRCQAQATLRCSADNQNYNFLIEIHDDEISADDRGYLMLSASSLGTSSRRIEFNNNGLKATKRYSWSKWSDYTFTAEVKTNDTQIEGGYVAEITIPRSVISPSSGKLMVNFGLYDSKTAITDLSGNEKNISDWIDIKGL